MSDKATLLYGENKYELPVLTGTENEKGIDISKLRAESGIVTYDVGYKNTGATTSAITFLNGEKGILKHRGYAIEDLTNKASFIEVAYLLIKGDLPTASQLVDFESHIAKEAFVPQEIKTLIYSFPSTAHPMSILMTCVSMLAGFYPEALDPNRSDELKEKTMTRLLAKVPVITALILNKIRGTEMTPYDARRSYVENFLFMCFGKAEKEVQEALNKLLILHGDHEQNCSASTVRIVGSSHANLYASIGAGIAALWGPLHGGANQKVLEMLEAIKNDGGAVDKYLDKAKDKNDSFRLMGFGHRVYKNFDPRARLIKSSCDVVLDKLGVTDPVLSIAKNLEQAALADDYFASRKLYPNVDFYSGIIYRAIGFPVEMFTVLFALGRLPGWLAQWKELREDKQPIGRPRQIYTGPTNRVFQSIKNR